MGDTVCWQRKLSIMGEGRGWGTVDSSNIWSILFHLEPHRWPSGKASTSRAEDPEFESRLQRDFSGSSQTSGLKIGTPVATLPGVIGSALRLVGPMSVCCD